MPLESAVPTQEQVRHLKAHVTGGPGGAAAGLTEREVLRKAVVGPSEWAMRSDLRLLQESFSQACSSRCVEDLALASLVHVAKCESTGNGGHHVITKAEELHHVLCSLGFLDRAEASACLAQ